MHTENKVTRRLWCITRARHAGWFAGLSLILLLASGSKAATTLPPNVEIVTVKTLSPSNPEVPFYVRRPARYSATSTGKTYRVLLITSFMNLEGLKQLTGSLPLVKLADERDWFVVAPTFRDKGGNVRNREVSYYYPEKWSGPAVLEALGEIKRKYPIDTERLFLQGHSGGAQFAHRFAIWKPEKVTAVAVNSASWFDSPNAHSAQVAWLVTIGDSDQSYENSLKMIEELRKAGAYPIFRSYLGMVHEGSAQVDALNGAFLSFYDDLTKSALGTQKHLVINAKAPLPVAKMPYVGDAQSWTYGKNEPQQVEEIDEDFRIYLPNDEIAGLWGKQVGK